MRSKPTRHLLLVLVLLLGQWLTVAHAFEQPSLAADHHCHVCSHAQALGAALPPAPPLPTLVGRYEAPRHVLDVARSSARVYRHPIRGPPQPLM